MATKTLVIDGTDREHFFLTVENGTLRIGDTAAHTEGIVRDLRILRIHCEVEVEDDREHVSIDEPGVLAPSTLSPGSAVVLGHAQLSIVSAAPAKPGMHRYMVVRTFPAGALAGLDVMQPDAVGCGEMLRLAGRQCGDGPAQHQGEQWQPAFHGTR